jgi:histidinol phosphatase-like PHP family hydrolase
VKNSTWEVCANEYTDVIMYYGFKARTRITEIRRWRDNVERHYEVARKESGSYMELLWHIENMT